MEFNNSEEETASPYENMVNEEFKSILYNFCTLCYLINGGKMNFQRMFFLVLSDDNHLEVLKKMFGFDNKYDVIRTFLKVEPSVATSKFISRYIKQLKKSEMK